MVVLALALTPLPALGVVTYDTTSGTNYAAAPTFDGGAGWQYVGTWNGAFTGTAIAPNYFITANHVGGNVGQAFTLNGVTYTTTATAQLGTSDMRLWRVDKTMPTFAPVWVPGTDGEELGKTATFIGRGRDRGSEAHANNDPNQRLNGWLWGANNGVLRWGQNRIAAVDTQADGSRFLKATFDATGRGDSVTNEATVSEGDSGGGMFLKSPVDGKWKLAGVVSGVEATFSYTQTGAQFQASVFDARGLYYQQSAGATPVLISSSTAVPASAYFSQVSSQAGNLASAWAGAETVWVAGASGTWGTAGNWWSPTSAVPDAGKAVVFGSAISAPTTVTLNQGRTVGSVQFDNAQRYTIAGTGATPLTLSKAGGASVTVASGSHTISAPVVLGTDAAVSVAAGSVLTMSGGVSGSGALTTSGAVEVRNVRAGKLAVAAGAVGVLADGTPTGVSVVKDLSIAGGAKLDLRNNSLVWDYDAVNRTGDVRAMLVAAYHRGRWDLGGLTSSAVGPVTTLGYAENAALHNDGFGGVSPDRSSVLVKYTYVGDANLDGRVDDADLALITPGAGDWMHGDFNYDGLVDADDYVLFGVGASGQGAALNTVPEPGVVSVVVMGLMGLGVRRGRRR